MEENYIFEDYFHAIWNQYISQDIVSQEYYDRNFDLIHEITFQFFNQYERSGNPAPQDASTLLITVFSVFQKLGLR